MRPVAYVNYLSGLLDEVWGVGETFENVDHVTWISGVWFRLYVLSLCVETWRCVSKENYVKRKTPRSIGFQIRHILLRRYVNIFVLHLFYVRTYVGVYVIKTSQAVKPLTGIWQIVSNLAWGTIFFILYQYLTLIHDGVQIIYWMSCHSRLFRHRYRGRC